MAVLDRGWRRIVSEIGVEFLLPEAVELLRGAGQIVEGENRVRFDPEFDPRAGRQGAARVRPAGPQPGNTRAHRRRPHGLRAGLRLPVHPRGRRAPRREDGRLREPRAALAGFPELDSPGGTICEPEDRPLDSRHLDMVYALQTLSDKPYMGSVTSGPNAADTIAMGEILFGGREAIERAPASISLINVNSPLRFDDRMLGAMFEYVKANQAVVITPVPADGRDVAGLAAGDAGPADRRGARRDRAHAADPPRLPGRLRLVPLEHRHAVGLAVVRHARVGHRRAVHRPDRAPLRAAVARRRRAERVARPSTRRPPTSR